MKLNAKLISLSVLISTLMVSIISCEDDIPNQTIIAEDILGTWEAGNVNLDGFDVTSPSYDEFAILFRADGSYFVQDGDPIFTSSGGFWRVISEENNLIELGGIETSYTLNEAGSILTLTFTANGNTIGVNARQSGLSGNYTFTLNSTERDIEE
ncbi:MAG: hypothetical protein AAF363_02935 [Bacteroidota bacterium]